MVLQLMWVKMRNGMMLKLIVMVCLMTKAMVDSSQAVMKSMTKNFLMAYEVCSKEYNLPEGTATLMMNFWKEDFSTTSRDAGCAIYCLSTKLNLIDPEGKLHHGNAKEFAMKHGSGEDMAAKLVEILHTCEQAMPPDEDKCVGALAIAMCFKKELHVLGWAPDPVLLFEELIAEMR